MRDEIKRLMDLQELDLQIRHVKKDVAEFKERIRERSQSVESAKVVRDALQAERRLFQKEADKREMELKAKEERIQKFKIQLNTIKTNKEYDALKAEIAGEEADRARLEDEVLTFLDKAEQTARKLRDAGDDVAKKEKDVLDQTAELRASIGTLETELAGIQEKRGGLTKDIPIAPLSKYERIRKSVDGAVLVPADPHLSVCSGCYMNITSQTINLLMVENDLILCGNCSRILYIDDGEKEKLRTIW